MRALKGAGALLFALLAGTAATAVRAQTVAITGGTVALGDGSDPIPGGTVIVRDGRIVAAGRGVAVPAGAQVVDATGKWVTPGIVAGFSRVGLVEVDAVGLLAIISDSSARIVSGSTPRNTIVYVSLC